MKLVKKCGKRVPVKKTRPPTKVERARYAKLRSDVLRRISASRPPTIYFGGND